MDGTRNPQLTTIFKEPSDDHILGSDTGCTLLPWGKNNSKWRLDCVYTLSPDYHPIKFEKYIFLALHSTASTRFTLTKG